MDLQLIGKKALAIVSTADIGLAIAEEVTRRPAALQKWREGVELRLRPLGLHCGALL